jgi:hypothetical protein
MKLIIAGDRDITDIAVVYDALLKFRAEHPGLKVTEIVSGCARGVDTLGEQVAREFDVPVKRFPADWARFGKAAGPIRNQQMADYADALVAVPVPTSRGTRDMIRRARSKGLIVTVRES